MVTCLFCQIVLGEVPAHIVWEDDEHVAFLSVFPNTDGVTVVIPKAHYGSDVWAMPEHAFHALLSATRVVALQLTRVFEDVGRTAVVFEGFGIDHVHAKLFPLHGTALSVWEPILSDVELFEAEYTGRVSTHDGPRADDKYLARIADRIRGVDTA